MAAKIYSVLTQEGYVLSDKLLTGGAPPPPPPEELSFTLGRNGTAANNVFLTLPGNVAGSTGRGIVVPPGSVLQEVLFRTQRAGADDVTYALQGADNTTFFEFTVPAGENNFAASVNVPIPNSPDPGSPTGSVKARVLPFVSTGVRPRGITMSLITSQP